MSSRLGIGVRRRTLVVGAALTTFVIIAGLLGALNPLEHWLLTMRTRWCQFFLAPPTQTLVHVDIDDAALERIGRWPWPRRELALVVDELRRAQADWIALDVLLSETQQPQWQPRQDGSFDSIDDDALLAQAIARHGRVILAADPKLPPVHQLAQHAADIGLVGYRPGDDIARDRPLLYEDEQQRLIHLGLLLALRMQNLTAADVRIEGNILHLGHDRKVPLIERGHDRAYRADALVPWFGPTGADGWLTMFDWPAHRDTGHHYPIVNLHAVARNAPRLRQAAVAAMRDLWPRIGNPERIDPLKQALAEENDPQIDALLIAMHNDLIPLREAYAQMTELDTQEALMLAILNDTTAALNDYLAVVQRRRDLKERFAGKAVLLGWTATAAYDEVTTPLHAKAPGVVVHGTVYNAAMTDQWWTAAPRWIDITVTAVIGLLAALIVATMSPLWAALCSTLLAAGWAAFNGIVLFDYGNFVANLAWPLTAVVLVWAGGTTMRFVIEQLERLRITQRFRSYVDPVLVDYVLAHPDQSILSGQERELTVVFTDLAGFTTLSEQLKADVVPLLSQYLQRMVPLIRQRRGYVNKFLGDGMMFFYGAPLDNAEHAIDAVATVLQMQEHLAMFNQTLAQRGLSPLAMRAGIGSGPMIVGDAGPADACDYTVIGDNVNLAARLEGANKATGTWVLINERTQQLVKDHFLLRPIARLQVVGKREGAMVYEPLCAMDEAGAQDHQFAELTARMVNAFLEAQFEDCLAAADELDAAFGQSKLTRLYRMHCASCLAKRDEPFNGLIVLTEK